VIFAARVRGGSSGPEDDDKVTVTVPKILLILPSKSGVSRLCMLSSVGADTDPDSELAH